MFNKNTEKAKKNIKRYRYIKTKIKTQIQEDKEADLEKNVMKIRQ